MSDKVYLGQNVSDLDYDEKVYRISRVNLSVDSDHIYTSGDDTWRTLEVSCPWGSQAMADSILAKVSGIDYQPYEASDALLDQAAEIGDGITLGGVYSVLAQSSISLDKQCAANISAPYNDEIDDEYPYKTPEQRKSERQLAYTRSLITKTAEEIRLDVSNELDSLSSSISVQLQSITSTVQGLNKKISTLTQTDSEIRAEITDQINDLSSSIDVKLGNITSTVQGLDGRVTTVEQTASGLTSSVQGLNGQVSTLQQTATSLTSSVQGINGEISTIEQTLQGVAFKSSLADGTTTINGGCITTGQILASYIKLGGYMDLYESLYNNTVYGRFGKTTVTVDGSSYDALGFTSLSNVYIAGSQKGFIVTGGTLEAYAGGNIILHAPTGSGVLTYGQVLAFNDTAVAYTSSDRRLKIDIDYDVTEKLISAFDGLKPVFFRLKNDLKDGQNHIGFIAQDVVEVVDAAGLGNALTAVDCNGNYALNYGEITALLTAKIKQLEKRLEALSA